MFVYKYVFYVTVLVTQSVVSYFLRGLVLFTLWCTGGVLDITYINVKLQFRRNMYQIKELACICPETISL